MYRLRIWQGMKKSEFYAADISEACLIADGLRPYESDETVINITMEEKENEYEFI